MEEDLPRNGFKLKDKTDEPAGVGNSRKLQVENDMPRNS